MNNYEKVKILLLISVVVLLAFILHEAKEIVVYLGVNNTFQLSQLNKAKEAAKVAKAAADEAPGFWAGILPKLGISAFTVGAAYKWGIDFAKGKLIDSVKDVLFKTTIKQIWLSNLFSLRMYLWLPGSDFPNKRTKVWAEILRDPYSLLLWEFFKLSKSESIASDNKESKGYIEQFKEGRLLDKKKYIQKIQKIFERMYPEKANEKFIQDSFNFIDCILEGEGDGQIAYLIQTLYLSQVGKLQESQWQSFFDIVYSKLVRTEDSNIKVDEYKKFAAALYFVTGTKEIQDSLSDILKSNKENPENEVDIKKKLYADFCRLVKVRKIEQVS